MRVSFTGSAEGRAATGRSRALESRGVAVSAVFAAGLGLISILGACDAEDGGLDDEEIELQERSAVCANKSSILNAPRPPFTGAAASLSCGANMSRDHMLSWESIRAGYYAALNPLGSTCAANVTLLYESVRLAPDTSAIANACTSANLSTNSVTPVDAAILSALNSSIDNLRCGHASANSSLGSALDVPCGDQRFNPGYMGTGRIEITGDAGEQLSSFFSIQTSTPRPPHFFKVDQPGCTSPITPSAVCDDQRLQTSDCANDTGAGTLPASTKPVFYQDAAGNWEEL
ncbi:MAG: hypothetical protein AB1Z98_22915 [Nannocystaceae bacterium]